MYYTYFSTQSKQAEDMHASKSEKEKKIVKMQLCESNPEN